jgi:predicted HTH transcriptional regulator
MASLRPDLRRLLIELLDDPREALAVEVKDWLDLEQRDVAANLARELLALANNGGGTLLFGFADRPAGLEPSGACPYAESGYSQD